VNAKETAPTLVTKGPEELSDNPEKIAPHNIAESPSQHTFLSVTFAGRGITPHLVRRLLKVALKRFGLRAITCRRLVGEEGTG
jgi:hypothetical protein